MLLPTHVDDGDGITVTDAAKLTKAHQFIKLPAVAKALMSPEAPLWLPGGSVELNKRQVQCFTISLCVYFEWILFNLFYIRICFVVLRVV